jgi:hypothetical protein
VTRSHRTVSAENTAAAKPYVLSFAICTASSSEEKLCMRCVCVCVCGVGCKLRERETETKRERETVCVLCLINYEMCLSHSYPHTQHRSEDFFFPASAGLGYVHYNGGGDKISGSGTLCRKIIMIMK